MALELTSITPNIHLGIFENQFNIASTCLRFQEYYESPEFKGKVFTLEEFKEWYIKNSPKGKATGKFTYYKDWNGFNLPSWVFDIFFKGEFNPLSRKEKNLLNCLEDKEKPFYFIGVHKKTEELYETLRHEVAHGLFYTKPEYKEETLDALSKFDLTEAKEELLSKGGYHPDVLLDECQAYALCNGLQVQLPESLSIKMNRLYNKHAGVEVIKKIAEISSKFS